MTQSDTTWGRIATGTRRFARFEIALALACLLVPLFLIAYDSWSIRSSISAYWDMEQNQVFYYGLTLAAMMFIVRGARSDKHAYSLWLGIALSGVILFNEEHFGGRHTAFAIAFFGGGVLAILLFSKGEWAKRVKTALLALVALVLVLWLVLDLISVFWAEWLAMVALAGHFIAHALEEIRSEARSSRTAPRYQAP